MSFNVGHRSVKLLAPHIDVVSNAMDIGARSCHTLDRPGSFFDLLVIQSAQRQLRCVKRDSIAAVDCRGGTKCDERFVSSGKLGVAEHPAQRRPVLFQNCIRHLVHEARYEAEVLRDLIDNVLSGHTRTSVVAIRNSERVTKLRRHALGSIKPRPSLVIAHSALPDDFHARLRQRPQGSERIWL